MDTSPRYPHPPGSSAALFVDAKEEVQDALDNLQAAALKLKEEYGSWVKAARAIGCDESTLRHHASAGARGRRKHNATKMPVFKGRPVYDPPDPIGRNLQPQPGR